jgi:hypothetical protein
VLKQIIFFFLFSQLIRELYSVTEASANGEDQSQKGTQLLEIYALEIQMHNETRNYKELKASDAFQAKYTTTDNFFSCRKSTTLRTVFARPYPIHV